MLKMQNVTKSFDKVKVLNDLTLTVPKGAVYGLVGANGAGKSTAIRLLMGIYRQDAGSITLEGKPVFEKLKAKRRMCCVPEEAFFFPSDTLEEMKKYYKGFYPCFDDALFDQLQDVFQLSERACLLRCSQRIQKQAAFQLSICSRPDVLILDETLDGLEPEVRQQIGSLILSEQEMTVLIASHNLRDLDGICDHIGVLDKGRMLWERSLDILESDAEGKKQTLEEILTYELGGADYDIKNILL